MRSYDLLRTGCLNLWRRKTRTFLTALSMAIGVMCIVVLISIGIGYGRAYAETVESMGSLTKIDVTLQQMTEGKTALLNDKAVESIKGLKGVEAATPVVQKNAYLKSGSYVTMVKLYGIDLDEAEHFLLFPVEGSMPGEGMRLHPELMVTDDLAASFADPGNDWADAVDENGEPLVDLLRMPVKLTFDYNTLNGVQSADSEGRAAASGKFFALNITGICSSQNRTYATAAFLDVTRLKEWEEASAETGGSISSYVGGGSASGGNESEDESPEGEKSGQESGGSTDGDSGSSENERASGESGTGTTASVGQSADTQRAPIRTDQNSSGKGAFAGAKQDTYDLVWVKAEQVSDVERIETIIRKAGFETYSLNEMLEAVKKQSRQIQGMLGAIGLVAMLVSAICVANTMMMSINERTREVGILKVMGMDFTDIAKMFLTEALLIGLAGGLAGMLLSFLMAALIPLLFAGMDIRCIIPWWLALGGILFSGAAALLAAWLPAKNAMRISPNEAMRAEL